MQFYYHNNIVFLKWELMWDHITCNKKIKEIWDQSKHNEITEFVSTWSPNHDMSLISHRNSKGCRGCNHNRKSEWFKTDIQLISNLHSNWIHQGRCSIVRYQRSNEQSNDIYKNHCIKSGWIVFSYLLCNVLSKLRFCHGSSKGDR